ncbi:MAG: DEAD/DEAH box helicase [Desulfobacterales bacterium]|nr:DEAD/DEAH box helicase [Desulfobacterales bacterium]MDD4071666.1 DEAD/DEAH box helicase [Desulfobacterales bacterium]MDD4393577.1 DEAD/DEAH box helicase [Desulfobacterales bacterium]
MKIRISNHLELAEIPDSLPHAIREKLTLTNPKWIENDRRGFSNYQTPRLLRFYTALSHGGLIVPRGFGRQLVNLCRAYGVSPIYVDQRRVLSEVDFTFSAQLRPYQTTAVQDMLKHTQGVLSAPTGSGKTIMALKIIAERRQPCLIVVHTRELLNQWRDRIVSFLGVPKDEIGIIGGGKKKIGGRITVGLVQSLYKCAAEVSDRFGHVVVDECHRTPSRTFTECVTSFDCKYLTGLSATCYRRDKLSRLIFLSLGDICHKIEPGTLQKTGDVLRAEIVTRETDFRTDLNPSVEYSKMLSELCADAERNNLIASDVARETRKAEGVCLVLSDRKTHCETLQSILADDFRTPSTVLTGGLSTKKRAEIIKQLNAGNIKVLISTTSLLSEGFDCQSLTTLFMATPIRFSGRVIQCAGRVLRPAPGKTKARVFDYIDTNIGPLRASATARRYTYEKHGIQAA